MSRRRFEVIILEDFCKGCGLCVEFCEPGKLYISPRPNRKGVQTAQVNAEPDCTGCLRCATICPDAAVRVERAEVSAASGGAAAEAQGR
ncbi:MAG: 4Fe-4S dicluster domain-containing protein [Planctomycetota bacterium]|jgi:2-oxoglutarate ferredoxin oxidoreductase subunit delta